jgi:hypothetical protein
LIVSLADSTLFPFAFSSSQQEIELIDKTSATVKKVTHFAASFTSEEQQVTGGISSSGVAECARGFISKIVSNDNREGNRIAVATNDGHLMIMSVR